MMNLLIKILATGLGSGYLRPAPGTWGSLLGLVIAWFGQYRWYGLLFPSRGSNLSAWRKDFK